MTIISDCGVIFRNGYFLVYNIIIMAKFTCRDYGFECDFVTEGDDMAKVIEEYGKHSCDEHGIEYSKETLMQFILRQHR